MNLPLDQNYYEVEREMWEISVFREEARGLPVLQKGQWKMQICEEKGGGGVTDFFRKKTKGKKEFHWQVSVSAVHCKSVWG